MWRSVDLYKCSYRMVNLCLISMVNLWLTFHFPRLLAAWVEDDDGCRMDEVWQGTACMKSPWTPYIWSCSKPRFPKKSQTYMKIPLNILKPGPLIGFLLGNLQIPSVVRPSGWHHHADCAAARHRRGDLGRREEIRGRRDARGRRAGEALQDVAGTWYHHFEWDWHAFLRWDTQM